MYKRLTSFLILAVALLVPASVAAQSFEELRNQMRREFASQQDLMRKQYREAREKMNREFAEALGKPWQRVDAVTPEDRMTTLPDYLPVYDEDIVSEGTETVVSDENVFLEEGSLLPQPQPAVPVFFEEKTDQISLFVDYFNAPCAVHFNPSQKVLLADSSEESVKRMWNELSSVEYDNLLADCIAIREEFSLCDWGYLLLTEEVSKVVYDNEEEADSRVALQAFLMNQTGYKIRLGRDERDKLHLFVASADRILDRSYWCKDDSYYYIADDSGVDIIYFSIGLFPYEKELRMRMDNAMTLGGEQSPSRMLQSLLHKEVKADVSVDMNLMSFYEDYPIPYIGSDTSTAWYFYANTPISQSVKDMLYPGLETSIKGKTKVEAVQVLLNFVQTAFKYKTDAEIWGEERYFFPEETLYYQYCDCEDRAILFSRIVRDLLGLDVLLVYYPNHLATAVHIPEDCPGDKLIYNGDKYVICDPSILYGSSVGKTMKDCDNSTADIIVLN